MVAMVKPKFMTRSEMLTRLRDNPATDLVATIISIDKWTMMHECVTAHIIPYDIHMNELTCALCTHSDLLQEFSSDNTENSYKCDYCPLKRVLHTTCMDVFHQFYIAVMHMYWEGMKTESQKMVDLLTQLRDRLESGEHE